MKRKLYIAIAGGASIALVGGIATAVFALNPERRHEPEPRPLQQPKVTQAPAPANPAPAPTPTLEPPKPTPTPAPKPKPKPPTAQYVPNPLSLQMVVNKKFQLRPGFTPPDLVTAHVNRVVNEPMRAEAANALVQLFAAASAEGVNLVMNSGYRSYAQQQALYNHDVAARGAAVADEFSARPGFSEHQSGLAADVAQAKGKPSSKNAAAWLAAHSHEYGYIIRFPAGKKAITGFHYEPWHIRYVGVALATHLARTGLTMEEYFKIPGGDY